MGTCLPVKFLTEFSCRPGSRFLPFAFGSNKNIAAPFKSGRGQSSLPAWAHKKICAHQDLNLEPTDYESVALTD